MYVFGPETHMTAIVGMALGQRPLPKPVKQESVAQPVHFLGSKNVSPYTRTQYVSTGIVVAHVYPVYWSCVGMCVNIALRPTRLGYEIYAMQCNAMW